MSDVPTRFLPRLEAQIALVLSQPDLLRGREASVLLTVYRRLREQLEDSFTKRILFSARQAGLFVGIGSTPPEIQRRLRLPFEQFYLELDDDLFMRVEGERVSDNVALRAMLLSQNDAVTLGNHPGHTLVDVAFFYRDYDIDGWMVDAEWLLCLTCGVGYIPAAVVRTEPHTGLVLPDDVPDNYLVGAPQDAQDGPLYNVTQGTALLSYLLAYLTAKAITIQAEPIPRQQRRWLERRGITPRPWHIIALEPRINTQPPPEEEPTTHHAFRYDVIGHLRFNRHRLADGSYRHTVEWVPAHQRGLDHVEYIPKTYRAEHGKPIHPVMREYYGRSLPSGDRA